MVPAFERLDAAERKKIQRMPSQFTQDWAHSERGHLGRPWLESRRPSSVVGTLENCCPRRLYPRTGSGAEGEGRLPSLKRPVALVEIAEVLAQDGSRSVQPRLDGSFSDVQRSGRLGR